MYQKVLSVISKSIKDHLGKISSSRVSSYFILAQILLSGMVFLIIDLINGIIMWNNKEIYSIPTEHIFIFGMILTHHLFLLGIKKSSEASPFPSLDKKEDKPKKESDDKISE